jgi:hypothetical protein
MKPTQSSQEGEERRGEGRCSLNVRRELTEMSFLRAREVELGPYARED